MAIQDFLATSLERRDQGPNHLVAERIVSGEFELQELVDFFLTKPSKSFQKDSILTIAYVARERPEWVTPYFEMFIENFSSKIDRVVWGSMISLSCIAQLVPEKTFDALPKIIDTMQVSTVVARDYGFRILSGLYSIPMYREDVFPLVLEQFQIAPSNQLGQYVERILPELIPEDKPDAIAVLECRLDDLSDPYHIRRLQKNLKRLSR